MENMSDSPLSDSESSSDELDSHSTSGSSSTSSSNSNCGSTRDSIVDSVDEGSGGNDIDHPAVAESDPTKATDPDPDPVHPDAEGVSDDESNNEAEEVLDETLDDENADISIRNVQKQASASYVSSLSTCHHVIRSEFYTSAFPHSAVRIILCPES